jgi:ADP-ribose pyrophosphatase YjhB (NUDIX family)
MTLFVNNHNFFRYVDLGETPNTAGIREVKEQTQIILSSNSTLSLKLVGVYNDPTKDISVELRSTITISYATEYISTEMPTTDGTNIPKATNPSKELLTLPLEEIGTTYTQEDFEEDHFSYMVLIDLKNQLNVTSSTRRSLQELPTDVVHSTCSYN